VCRLTRCSPPCRHVRPLYINDFTLAGRNWQVNMQAEGEFRSEPDDLRRVFVRADNGAMVPLTSLVRLDPRRGRGHRQPLQPVSRGAPAGGTGAGIHHGTGEGGPLPRLARRSVADAALGWIGEAYQLEAGRGRHGGFRHWVC
jgi:hypothetical protein